MTAADGARLTRLDDDLWVDLDQVVAVHVYTDDLTLQRRVEVTLVNGTAYAVDLGPAPGTGNPLTDLERGQLERAWLGDRLGPELLEDVRRWRRGQ